MISEKGRSFCRKIDQVCMEETKGQKKEIYCFDVFHSEPLEEEQKPEDDTPNGKFIRHIDFEGQDTKYIEEKGGLQYIYELDHDFVSMKKHLLAKHDFYEFYNKAVENYIDGDWVNAQSNLNSAA